MTCEAHRRRPPVVSFGFRIRQRSLRLRYKKLQQTCDVSSSLSRRLGLGNRDCETVGDMQRQSAATERHRILKTWKPCLGVPLS